MTECLIFISRFLISRSMKKMILVFLVCHLNVLSSFGLFCNDLPPEIEYPRVKIEFCIMGSFDILRLSETVLLALKQNVGNCYPLLVKSIYHFRFRFKKSRTWGCMYFHHNICVCYIELNKVGNCGLNCTFRPFVQLAKGATRRKA